MLYYNQCPQCLAETIQQFPFVSLAAAPEIFKQVQADIIAGYGEAVHPQLYDMYRENYHKGINGVLGTPKFTEEYFELSEKFKLNTARVAAYKSHNATTILKQLYEADPKKFSTNCDAVLKTFNRWQATEYNTAVARTRTAKQFEQFRAEKELYPNIEWLATRSSTPRELHAAFVGLILPQDDPFWQENQPGNLYNCKCDWRTSDKPAGTAPEGTVKPAAGLDGNPASTGEVFSDKHPYFKKAGKEMKAAAPNIIYEDSVAKFPISVIADKIEIGDNIATARILVSNIPDIKIQIREHVIIKDVTNPEFVINGHIADAKRLKGYRDKKGIKNSFKNAIGQGCKSVIIDFNKHLYNVDIDVTSLAKKIYNRKADFIDGKIIECFVVFQDKAVLITMENNEDDIITLLQKLNKP